MKIDKKTIIAIAVAAGIVVLDIIFLSRTSLFYLLIILSLIILILPFIISIVIEGKKQSEKESFFLDFVRDLVENVRSGTPISKGILNLNKRNYGALTPDISKLANQISLGIPLTSALANFARDTKSSGIARAVSLISQAERAGGKIDTILESVLLSVNQAEELKKERKAAVSNLVVQGYIIFIVFIIIMLVLEFQILPMTSGLGNVEGLSVKISQMTPEQFSTPLFVLLLVQSFFAGLVIGKISEGSLKQGLKHSFILLAIALITKTGANALLG